MAPVIGKAHFNGSHFGRRKREKLIFFFIAGLALSVFILVLVIFVYKSNASTNKAIASQEAYEPSAGTVMLYTSDRPITAGAKISADLLKTIYWPKNLVPEGAIADIEVLDGAYAIVDIPVGDPITKGSITKEGNDRNGLQLQQGMRAVTIEVDAKRGLEGWALPGTRVDVILTFKDNGELTSKVVVENSRVLSIAGNNSTNNERLASGRHRINAPTTVTLEATPKDALKLETAAQLGKLSLHLRSQDDSKSSGIDSFGSSDFDSQAKKAAQKKLAEDSNKVACQKGKMKIEGKEYIIDCSGNLVPVN